MHILHLLAVEADDAAEAVAAAEEFLDPYADEVFDWYQVGGRWSGTLAGGDVLCAAADLPGFLAEVDGAVAARHAEMREMRRWLVGPDGSGEVHDPFGFGADARARDRVAAAHQESAALFAEAMAAGCPEGERFEMLGYRMTRLGRLMAGYYTYESRFFDAAWGSAGPDKLRERVVDEPGRQWLVAVDLHH